MYARLVHFTLGPGKRDTGEGLSRQFDPLLRARDGFVSATFIADYDNGVYGALVLWDSKEAAEATIAEVEPQLQAAIGDIVTGPPLLGLYEVFEP